MDNKQRVSQMAEQRYRRPEVAAAVLASADNLGTIDRIADGELSLPGEQDANHWHDREIKAAEIQSHEAKQQATIDALSARLEALEQGQHVQPVQSVNPPANSPTPQPHNG